MHRKILSLSLIIAGVFLIGAGCVSFSSSKTGASGPAGMFISQDKGESWAQSNSLLTAKGLESIAGVNIYRLVEDPEDTDALYLATRENGLFYTYDGGKTWQHAGAPLATGFIYDVAVHPQNKCVIYATNGRQIFKTDDCSRHWTEIYRESRSDVFVTSIAFNYFTPFEVYTTETNGDLLQSNDGGQSWKVLNRLNVRLVAVVASHLQPNLLYVITRDKGLYRSDDGGANWINLQDKLKVFSGALEYRRYLLHPAKPNILYWISTYGILVSNDRGENWQALNLITPPGSADIYGFAVNPKNDQEIYYTATVKDRSTFYKSIDGGKSWITKKLPTDQRPVALRVHPQNDSRLYLGFAAPPETKSQPAFFVGQ